MNRCRTNHLLSMLPHTYGLRVCSCAAFSTEPCRPTACAGEHPHPAAYPTTANYSLHTANSTADFPVPPAHPIQHSTFSIQHWTYTFSAKEKDSETGLSYFGSRYYSSDLSIWLSVDPMSDKYPSLSPYVYCANNPVKVVDPNGEEIWIIGEDGSRIKYVQGMTYEGHDKGISNKVDVLNQMNSTKNGRRLLDKLTSSNNFYSITDNIDDGSDTKDAYFCANDLTNGKAGGAIITQGTNDLRTISHELFHAYQDECGQGGSSIHNEVEAMLFQTSVITEYGWNNKTYYPASPLLGNVKAYNNIVDDLLDGYSSRNINKVVNYFKNYSGANKAGTYKNYPPKLSNQSRDIIQDFYPLLPWKK